MTTTPLIMMVSVSGQNCNLELIIRTIIIIIIINIYNTATAYPYKLHPISISEIID